MMIFAFIGIGFVLGVSAVVALFFWLISSDNDVHKVRPSNGKAQS